MKYNLDSFIGDFHQMKEDIALIKRKTLSGNKSTPQHNQEELRDWLPRLDFLQICSISQSQLRILEQTGKIHKDDVKRLGRKVYIHRNVVDQYFDGQLL